MVAMTIWERRTGQPVEGDLLIELRSCDTRVDSLNDLLRDNNRVDMLWSSDRSEVVE
jgi:hypothetical protein